MKLSYIVVTYRSEDQVGNLIDSIVAQRGTGEFEIIVVDNSIDESSAGVLREKLPTIKLIQNERNRGFTAAVNQGIREAKGDFVFMLNPDVVLMPGCAETLLGAFSDNTVGAAAPQMINPDGSIQKSVRNFPRFSTLVYESLGLGLRYPKHRKFGYWRNLGFSHDELKSVEQPMASAFMVRKDTSEVVGPWDDDFFVFFSDVDYCKRIIDAGYKIMFVPKAKAIHEGGGSTRREGSWLVWDSHRGFSRYLRKHELKGFRKMLRPLAGLILFVGGLARVTVRKIAGRGF